MKKSFIVLLIAVLVAGFAFAGTLKGSASLEFNVDLKKATRTWEFKNASEWAYSFEFEYDSTAVEVNGEGKLWAELAISGYAWIGVEDASGKEGNLNGKYAVELSKANIHIGDDLIIGLLNEGNGKDFAHHYWLDPDTGEIIINYVKDDHNADKIGGFTVTYKDFFGGFGAKGRWDTDPAQFTFYGHLATPEFKFAENQIIVQAGGYAGYANNTNVFANASFVGAGAKAEYAADKLNAYVGVDMMYDAGFRYEALAQASYTINDDGYVGADLYAANGQFRGYAGDDENKPIIDADVYASYTLNINDDIDVNIFASVEITDALVEGREIGAFAKETATVKEFTFTLSETYYVFAKNLMLMARVDYAGEKFAAFAQVDPWFSFGSEASLIKLGASCGISTTSIIDKAELGLKYTRADFAKAGDAIKDAGLVTAYVTIAFDNTPAEE